MSQSCMYIIRPGSLVLFTEDHIYSAACFRRVYLSKTWRKGVQHTMINELSATVQFQFSHKEDDDYDDDVILH